MKTKSWDIRAVMLSLLLILLVQFGAPLQAQAAQARAHILLESYEIAEGRFLAGEKVTLRFTFKNASEDTQAAGILITYGVGSSGIVPVYGESNQIYIPSLGAGERYVQEIECQVLNRQSDSTALIYFSASYRDDVSGGGSNDFMVAIPLESPVELQIENMTLPSEFRVQTQTASHLTISNNGDVDASQVILHCEGAIQPTQKTLSIGEIASGESVSIDLSLTFQQEGERILQIWLEYQDENRTTAQSEPMEFKVTVSPAASREEVAIPGEEPSELQGTLLLLGVGVLALAFVLGVWVYWKTKQKNKFVD